MVTDAKAVDAVVFGKNGATEGCDKNSLLIDMGTTSVIQTREFSEQLRGSWVDAPVPGGTTAAENGTLTIMAGGTKEAFSRALPLLQVMGEHITHVGKTGAGKVAKSANQMIAAVAKAFALARHNGVESAQIREVLFGGFAHSRVLELHGERMIKKDFTPRAKCSIQRKDITAALTLAKSVNLTLPSLTANMELWDHMVNNDMADLDHSALLLEIDPIVN
jgi:3-hydroxyisobutyrate dehydrogenase-like beta-hydroxyacid dehydrogenase